MKHDVLDEQGSGETHISMTEVIQKALCEQPDVIQGGVGEDHNFLAQYIWPIVKRQTMDHDYGRNRCKQ